MGSHRADGRFRVTFLPAGITVTAVEGKRLGDVGEAGSLLDVALAHGVAVDHSCGGVAGCATCHCIVREGSDTLPPPAAGELAQLRNAVGRGAQSRLSCQAVPRGGAELVVEIPLLE